MAETFDPYYQWLSISPKDQPPNHYRLLGTDLFESDWNVISNAADQRMAHVRSFQAGQHAAESQKILNEIAAARVCLLMLERRQPTTRRCGPRSRRTQPRSRPRNRRAISRPWTS